MIKVTVHEFQRQIDEKKKKKKKKKHATEHNK